MDVQTVSVVIAAIGIFIAGINSILSSRREEKQRQTQLFMELYDRFNETEFSKIFQDVIWVWEWRDGDYDDFIQKYGPPTNTQSMASFLSIVRYIQGISVLVQQKLIDVRIVNELLRRQIMLFTLKFDFVFQIWKTRLPGSKVADQLRFLYDELQVIEPLENMSQLVS
jgi:hypothetical protein